MMIMNIFCNFLENNAIIINSELLKFKNMDWSTLWIVNNCKNHIKFHSKLFIMIKYVVKNEMKNEIFFLRPIFQFTLHLSTYIQ